MRRFFCILLLAASLLGATAQTGQVYNADRLSSTVITSICQDKAGYIWIGTEYGLNRFDGYRFTQYFHNPDDSTSLFYNVVSSLFCDRSGQLWVGTTRGLQRFCYATDQFINYHFPYGHLPRVSDFEQAKDGTIFVGTSGYGLCSIIEGTDSLAQLDDYQFNDIDSYFNQVFIDGAGRFWKSGSEYFTCRMPDGKLRQMPTTYGQPVDFFEYQGKPVVMCRDKFLIYDNDTLVEAPFDLSALPRTTEFRTAFKDRVGNVYVGTRGDGLLWMPAGTRQLVRHPVVSQDLDVTSSRIWALSEDAQGNVWAGCSYKGLLMVSNRKSQFTSWTFSGQKIDIGTYVTSLCRDDDGLTWCTVQADGIFAFDENGRVVAHPAAPEGVDCIYRDSRGDFWVGASRGAYRYNPHKGTSWLVAQADCDSYTTMTDDGRGHMFFSTFGRGVQMYDLQTGAFRQFTMSDVDDPERGRLCNNWVLSLIADRDGRVWMATSAGVTCYDPVADTFKPFGWTSHISDKLSYSLCETREGDILMGTEQGLYVWRRSSNKLEPFPHSEQLSNLSVSYIVQDNDGNIWCSTSKGLWHYQAADERWVNYVSGSGLTVSAYPNSRGMHTPDDRIFFTTSDGITTFTPQQVHSVQATAVTVHLTNFFIGNQPVNTLTESGGKRVTDQPVNESRHFTVSYLDNSFSMEFSLLNYSNTANTIFEYRLNNDKEWSRTVEGQNAIAFNHLPSGTYEVSVRAVDNTTVSDVQVYTIVVTGPWYLSTPARLLYLLAALLLIAFAVISYRRRMRRQLEEDKMKFLINATHDIRSPLTLIMSPLQKLRRRDLDSDSQADLDVIDRNAQRILMLVNQILDIRKIDKQQMHLHCRQTNLNEFMGVIYKVYEYNARERNINFTLTTPEEPVMAWVDRTQFDKVLSNLLSNAFKYTFDQGDIAIHLSQGHDEQASGALRDYIEMTVTDNGTGMREDTIQHIFDRFYQDKGYNNTSHIEGTGIGMNLCKMIVDMHHGTITAQNRTDGVKGSVFTVRLPQGNGHLTEAEIDNTADQPATIKMTSKRQPRSNYRVLIVDDDEEIGRYISSELGTYYYFAVCHNGKDGLHELLRNPYDVVISDVMMPEMDGFTMLRMVKTNANISHLPVIMLTSKSDVGNRLEGLEKGADAYISKPFSMDELHLTIDNLIANHLRLKGKFSGAQQQADKVEQIEVKGNDEQLMERIMKSVNHHLGDSDFSIDQLCEEVGISRAHLHRKMKDMTGIPVSEFIRNIRLEQSARLLREQKLNITQVAYAVGFSNLGYFSTVFRKHFGLSPREFMDQEENDAG